MAFQQENFNIDEDQTPYPFSRFGRAKSTFMQGLMMTRLSAANQLAHTGYNYKGLPLGLKGIMGGTKPGAAAGSIPGSLRFGMGALGYSIGGPVGAVAGVYAANLSGGRGLLELSKVSQENAKKIAYGKTLTGDPVILGKNTSGIFRNQNYNNLTRLGTKPGTFGGNVFNRALYKIAGKTTLFDARVGMQTKAFESYNAALKNIIPHGKMDKTFAAYTKKTVGKEAYSKLTSELEASMGPKAYKRMVATTGSKLPLSSATEANQELFMSSKIGAFNRNIANVPVGFSIRELDEIRGSITSKSKLGEELTGSFRRRGRILRKSGAGGSAFIKKAIKEAEVVKASAFGKGAKNITMAKLAIEMKDVNFRLGIVGSKLGAGASITDRLSAASSLSKLSSNIPTSFLGQMRFLTGNKRRDAFYNNVFGITSETVKSILSPKSLLFDKGKTTENMMKWFGNEADRVKKGAEFLKQIGKTPAGVSAMLKTQSSIDALQAFKMHGVDVDASLKSYQQLRRSLFKYRSNPAKLKEIVSKVLSKQNLATNTALKTKIVESISGSTFTKTAGSISASAIARSAKLLFAFQIGAEAVDAGLRGVWNVADKARLGIDKIRRREFGSGRALTTQQAGTERQRALQMIQSNHMAARSFLGMEASFVNQ